MRAPSPRVARSGAPALVTRAERSLRRATGDSLLLRRFARTLGFTPANARSQPSGAPVGVKLELTYRCNLTCPFCYTDSPRRTRERAPDLPDASWLRIVDDAIALGVLEAVVTGGEPLLRRELALEAIERLAGAGVGVTLNTNGWFVDDEVAERVARVPGFRANVSIDGASPALHDSIRGVRGSWQRAVLGVDRLVGRGVGVSVVHVVTPENERGFAEFLDLMWLLGVRSIRVTPAVPVGAAAREGTWNVDGRELRRTIDRFRTRSGGAVSVRLGSGTVAALASLEDVAPAALLVRPNGSVWVSSMEPFSFGNAERDGLRSCWERVRERWWDPEIQAWAGGVRTTDDFVASSRVPYRDPEHDLVGATSEPERREPVRTPRRRDPAVADAAELDDARRFVRDLVLARTYEVASIRAVDDGNGGRYVRVVRDGRVCRLNRTAARVLDACAGGTLGETIDALARAPGGESGSVERDVLATIHLLSERGVLQPPASGAIQHD
jgi:Fe-coproporphyrin III synthase